MNEGQFAYRLLSNVKMKALWWNHLLTQFVTNDDTFPSISFGNAMLRIFQRVVRSSEIEIHQTVYNISYHAHDWKSVGKKSAQHCEMKIFQANSMFI